MARRRYYDDYYPSFARSRPKEAKGGIKAKSARGSFGESWWAKRWIAVLESFNIGARLGRGRNYARKGQVLNIRIDKGTVTADVQGSRPKPYKVTISVKSLGADHWAKLADVMSHEALFAAKLMAGEMPQDIETVFKEAGLSLFPTTIRDLDTDCSCPDASNPCKHIAAVYYLLGEEFDRDPFLIFKLRGMNREEFTGLLEVNEEGAGPVPTEIAADESKPASKSKTLQASPKKKTNKTAQAKKQVQEPERQEFAKEKAAASRPLNADAHLFWNIGNLPEDLFGEIRETADSAALVKRLGAFPFWRGALPLVSAMEPVYERAARIGINAFLGEIRELAARS